MNGIFFCSLAAITWPYGKLLMRICDLVFMAHEWSKSKFSVIPILALGYCYYVTNIKIENKLQKRERESEREREKTWICVYFSKNFNANQLFSSFSVLCNMCWCCQYPFRSFNRIGFSFITFEGRFSK